MACRFGFGDFAGGCCDFTVVLVDGVCDLFCLVGFLSFEWLYSGGLDKVVCKMF